MDKQIEITAEEVNQLDGLDAAIGYVEQLVDYSRRQLVFKLVDLGIEPTDAKRIAESPRRRELIAERVRKGEVTK